MSKIDNVNLDDLSFILQGNLYFGYSIDTLSILHYTAKSAYTYLRYLEIIFSSKSKYIRDSLTPIVFSLQESLYIDLFKLVDTGKEAQEYNMKAFVDYLDEQSTQKPLHFWNSLYSNYMNKTLLKSIRLRRNKVFAHNLGEDAQSIFDISHIDLIQLKEFLIFCIKLTYPSNRIDIGVVSTDIKNIEYFEQLVKNLNKEVAT